MTPSATRQAEVDDAETVAGLLDAFNREFGTPSPGVAVLTDRLRTLLDGPTTIGVLAGNPALGCALLTLRSNVWYAGPVATLDELYVVVQCRGRGVGSTLLAAAESSARDNGAELVEINVDSGDVAARRFYARHGYRNQEADRADRLLLYFREFT